MNKLYHISAELPTGDYNLDLFSSASSPKEALDHWFGFYAEVLRDEGYTEDMFPIHLGGLCGEEDIRVYEVHADLAKTGPLQWREPDGVQLVAGVKWRKNDG